MSSRYTAYLCVRLWNIFTMTSLLSKVSVVLEEGIAPFRYPTPATRAEKLKKVTPSLYTIIFPTCLVVFEDGSKQVVGSGRWQP